MFEKESVEYLKKEGAKSAQIFSTMLEEAPLQITSKQIPYIFATVAQAFQDGAEYGYNKALEEATHNYNAIIADYDKRIADLEKENAELKKDRDYFSGALDKQVEATLELQKKYQELEKQIEKMKCCGNCKYFRFVNGADYYTCIKDGKRNGEDYRSCGLNLEKWKLWV